MTDIRMATACAGCALPSVGGISIIPGHAVLTLPPSGEILALLADVVIDAGAVSITLASWTLDERPLVVLLFGAQTGVEDRLAVVCSANSHWSPGGPFSAVPSPCVTGVVAPATARLLQALSTGS